jgi:hypothetical protein
MSMGWNVFLRRRCDAVRVICEYVVRGFSLANGVPWATLKGRTTYACGAFVRSAFVKYYFY